MAMGYGSHTMGSREQNSSTLVVGLGMTGLSVVQYLRAQGQSVSIADRSRRPANLARLDSADSVVEFRGGEFDSDWFCGFSRIVVSPGVALDQPAIVAAKSAGVDVIGDVELYARHCRVPSLAVTGSNGKSTVAMALGQVLNACDVNAAVGGNIGVPVLSLLDPQQDFQAHVLELSSFQLEATSSLQPKAAALLNLSADHMDRYRDLDAYLGAKARIFADQTIAVLNREDRRVMSLQPALGEARCVSFGLSAPQRECDYGLVDVDGRGHIVRGEQRLLDVDSLALTGVHNYMNVMAAIALAEQAGVDPVAAAAACRGFTGLAHRMEVVGEWRGVNWVNDSKGTNVGATVAAVSGSDRPVVLIAGGEAKQKDFSELSTALGRRARAVVLIGRDAELMEQSLSGVAVFRADSLEAAIALADSIAVAGDCVLLSPACASFDMFDNFAHRGDVFKSLVRERFES